MFTTAALTVGAIAVPINQLHGICTISRRENESSAMDLTLITAAGLQDVEYWKGKAIILTVDAVTAFNGIIDEPIIDVIGKKITLTCSDTRRERLNTGLAATIDTIGFYSDAIFSEADNVIDELDQRLQTIPSVADILPDGTVAVTDINPKTIPDFTLLDADVYRRRPNTSVTSRGKLTNQVDLSFKYRWPRFRHRDRQFKIEDDDFCTIIEAVGSFTLKRDFLNYASYMDWIVNPDSIVWEDLPASGLITICNVADFAWIHDNTAATSMTYDATTRFAQTITEDFSITVKAPQSITQYGVIQWAQNYGYGFKEDAKDWESYDEYSAPTGGVADVNDYYIDNPGLTEDFENAILAAINIANTKIIKTHRDTQTNFEVDLRLDINLTHTIALSATTLTAKGKVTAINHTLNFSSRKGNSEIEISQSTAQGAQIADPIVVPARPAVPVVADAFVEPFVMLIVDGDVVTPAIDDLSRDEQVVAQAVTYDIEIQNDPHTVTF